jgi:hypothetical protein
VIDITGHAANGRVIEWFALRSHSRGTLTWSSFAWASRSANTFGMLFRNGVPGATVEILFAAAVAFQSPTLLQALPSPLTLQRSSTSSPKVDPYGPGAGPTSLVGARMRELAVGAVQPSGWLKTQLQIQVTSRLCIYMCCSPTLSLMPCHIVGRRCAPCDMQTSMCAMHAPVTSV